MKYFILFSLLISQAFAQNSLDDLRWYLKPDGQKIIIAVDDLHDEIITASPAMNLGLEIIPQLRAQKDIVVAVIDGGLEIEHPELKDAIAFNTEECFSGTIIPEMKEDKDKNGYKGDCAGWNFVENNNRAEDLDGHGTHVSGIIHSTVKNLDRKVKILPLKVFAPDEGSRSVKVSSPLSTRLTKAFEYAMSRKVDVIHMSVGWPKSFMTYELEQTIIKAQNQGIIIVSAAGNSSQRASIYPCQMKGVICVGALRANGEVARFSNWGSQVDIQGPGEKILSTIPHPVAPLHISRRGYDFKNGTSQAAPFISGAVAILKAINPEETRDTIYARLMMTALKAKDSSALKGLFQLTAAVEAQGSSFIFPELKAQQSVVKNEDNSFSLTMSLKNFWLDESRPTKVQVSCGGESVFTLNPMAAGSTQNIAITGFASKSALEVLCSLTIQNQLIPFKLKVLNKLKAPYKSLIVPQDELLVAATRMGAKSRFMTLDTLAGSTPEALYYIAGAKDVMLYREDQRLGSIVLPKDCQLLRVWQGDLNKDQINDLMVESTCAKTHLLYQFLDVKFNELFPAVKYRPSLAIVNYNAFELIPNKDAPPTFRFLNVGLGIPDESPWENQVTAKKNHLYELRAVKDETGWKFDVFVLENPKLWMKSLNLRTLPEFRIFHVIKDKMLVMIGQKTAWVDIQTQTATWAKLDDLLLMGSQKQELHHTKDSILQSFLTPYEYRGFVFAGVKLRYNQENRSDPLIDILGTEKNAKGYLTILRSFQNLIYVQYDEQGVMLTKTESMVDRFDFLTAQDLIASVINLSFEGRMLQVVDGTKINTDYIDVMSSLNKMSYEIPANCVSQQPVVMDKKLVLPVFCGKTKNEFEMRFIEL
jgi:hypothetical protein